MDFRIIQIDGKNILLQRIEGEGSSWQVIISVYLTIEYRFDEWVLSLTAQQARQYIADFSTLSTRQFLNRAEQKSSEPKKVRSVKAKV